MHKENFILLVFRRKLLPPSARRKWYKPESAVLKSSPPWQSHRYAINAFPFTVQTIFPQSLLIFKASHSHSGTLHLVGLLWTSDQPDEGTSTRQHTILTTDRHPCTRRNSNPQSQQESVRRPKRKTARLLGWCTLLLTYLLHGAESFLRS